MLSFTSHQRCPILTLSMQQLVFVVIEALPTSPSCPRGKTIHVLHEKDPVVIAPIGILGVSAPGNQPRGNKLEPATVTGSLNQWREVLEGCAKGRCTAVAWGGA